MMDRSWNNSNRGLNMLFGRYVIVRRLVGIIFECVLFFFRWMRMRSFFFLCLFFLMSCSCVFFLWNGEVNYGKFCNILWFVVENDFFLKCDCWVGMLRVFEVGFWLIMIV